MNKGIDLVALAQELTRQRETAKDYIAPQGSLEMAVVENAPVLRAVEGGLKPRSTFQVGVRDHAHGQLATNLGIPKLYYDRMRSDQPELLARNVNTWLHEEPKTKRMVRTLDGAARAILSSSYRSLDNYDLAEAALPILAKSQAQVVSSAITEQRLYIKAIMPSLSDSVPEGLTLGVGHNSTGKDVVVAGIVISNSEVGAGAIRIEPMVFKTRCTNLLIISESKMRKHHVGRDQGVDFQGSEIEELLRDETKHARDVAFWNMVRDVVNSAFSREVFMRHVERMRAAAEDAIVTDDLPKVIELTSKRLALPEALNNSVLKQLAGGGDLSRWGLVNAYTAVANDAKDYETSTLLERAGGDILALSKPDWKVLAAAA